MTASLRVVVFWRNFTEATFAHVFHFSWCLQKLPSAKAEHCCSPLVLRGGDWMVTRIIATTLQQHDSGATSCFEMFCIAST